MKKKTLTFEILYASERPYAGDRRQAIIRASRCELLWSSSLRLAVVVEKGIFTLETWLRISTRAMACYERSEALKQGMALIEVLEKYHAANKVGNHDECLRLMQLAEVFGDSHRWYEAMYGDQQAPPAQDPPAPPPAALPN